MEKSNQELYFKKVTVPNSLTLWANNRLSRELSIELYTLFKYWKHKYFSSHSFVLFHMGLCVVRVAQSLWKRARAPFPPMAEIFSLCSSPIDLAEERQRRSTWPLWSQDKKERGPEEEKDWWVEVQERVEWEGWSSG